MTRFKGWICRTWTELSDKGFVPDIKRFNTEEEADRHGRAMMRLPFKDNELSREYEVYADYDLEVIR